MKKAFLLISLILMGFRLHAQEEGRGIIISAFASTGKNQPVRLTRKYVTEDVGPFHGKLSIAYGTTISVKISERMRLETGAGFSEHNCGFELSPPIYPESKIYPEKIKTFFIPVSIYCYFNKNFYLNIGIMADFEASRKDHWIDSQEGIGFNIATGKEFRINSLVINVSPGMEIHGIIPFQPVENQLRLAVFGIKAGVGYNFKKHEKKTTDQVTE